MAGSFTLGTVNHLDTKGFNDAIEAFKNGIEEYNSIKADVSKTTKALFFNWQGKGKKQYESDYTTIYQQLNDIADIMYELYDSLVDAKALYIQADVEAAKLLTMG